VAKPARHYVAINEAHELKPQRPSRWGLWREASVALELAGLGLRYSSLTRHKSDFAHPVVLFPGFGTDEVAMAVLHHFLKKIGAEVHHWGLGRNHGYVPDLLTQAMKRVRDFTARGTKVHLVGWSLGGYIARDVEKREVVPIENEILAIYSKADAVVDWQACIDRRSPRVIHAEISGSHLGLVVNANAFALVRDFLQQGGEKYFE
jgi:hypothetical protein